MKARNSLPSYVDFIYFRLLCTASYANKFMEESTAWTWQDQVRRGLTSDDVRLRLNTYTTLSTKCSESKEMQKQVGQLFGGSRNDVGPRFATSSLMNVLFDDLRSTDRTLRIAAARVLCLMAYENLTNQQFIIRSQVEGDEEQVGVTVGWVHVFSVPQSLRDRYEAQCEEKGMFTTPSGLVEFVSNLIKDNYASIYSRIGRYYAGGCREFLPLCWFLDLMNDSSEATDIDVPDPNENLVGFYLVPRQMQFPEQDEYFLQEILASIQTEAELLRLQQVQTAFQQVSFRARDANAVALKTALEVIDKAMAKSFEDGEEAFIVKQRHSNVLHWLSTNPERTVTWNELLIWCCTDMNADEMLKHFGADACRTVDTAFRKLTLGSEGVQPQKDQVKSYVWESTLVGALLDHPNLPDELKTNLRNFPSKYVNRLELSRPKVEGNTSPHKKSSNISSAIGDGVFERPWDYLLPLKLTEIHPVSWSVFLSKWRQSADTKPEEDVNINHQNSRRHHSVGEGANPSLLVARKNALINNPRIFHSFRDLNQLRQQLPLITNRPSEVNDELEEFESTSRLRSITCQQISEEEERLLEEKRKLFRRLQQSSTNLDELTRQRLKEKQEARNKAHEKAAENRKKAEQLAAQRQQELERTRRDRQVKVEERVRRKEYRWRIQADARQERHERAQWWKRIQHEAEVERQEEFMQQLTEERASARILVQNQHQCHRSNSEPASLAQPPSTPPSSQRRVPCPRRPLSARTATDPQIIRERAQVYGCAATKAFSARRPQSARASFSSGTRSPNTRQQSTSFRRRVRPASDDVSSGSQKDVLSASTTMNSTVNDPHATGVANACETLVMTNAAHAVAQEIAIPSIVGPVPKEESVPPAVIMAQYLALEKDQRFKLHERYCVNRVSHKLTFAVLQQLTHEMRQDSAWREFLKAAGGPQGTNTNKRNKSKREAKVTYTAFANVANQLGISIPPKKLQAVARSLDPWKTGFVSWESFYTWWSAQ